MKLQFNPLLGLAIFVGGILIVFALATDACVEDENEPNDLGLAPVTLVV